MFESNFNFKKHGDKINEMEENFNRRAGEFINNTEKRTNEIREQNERWKRDRYKLKENKESETNQVTDFDSENNNKDTCKCNEDNNNEITENKVIGSDSEDSENISDNHNDDKLSANELSLIHI